MEYSKEEFDKLPAHKKGFIWLKMAVGLVIAGVVIYYAFGMIVHGFGL